MTRTPTGRILQQEGRPVLRLTRTFRAPREDVWAAVTEPDRLRRWIGSWSGDPATGRVTFVMEAEGDATGEEMEIRECVPPRVLRLTSHVGEAQWHLDLVLEEHEGVTTLTFEQPGIDPTEVESTGPGWEYYLDRLVAAESGGEVAEIDFERDYYPAMLGHYRDQAR